MSLRETLPLFLPEDPTLLLQSMDAPEGLQPCNTCRNTPQAVYREISRYGGYYVFCEKCGTSISAPTAEKVIELWNRRQKQ